MNFFLVDPGCFHSILCLLNSGWKRSRSHLLWLFSPKKLYCCSGRVPKRWQMSIQLHLCALVSCLGTISHRPYGTEVCREWLRVQNHNWFPENILSYRRSLVDSSESSFKLFEFSCQWWRWWASYSPFVLHACPVIFKLLDSLIHFYVIERCSCIVLKACNEFQPLTHLQTREIESLISVLPWCILPVERSCLL